MVVSPVQFQFGDVVLSNVVGQYSGAPHTDPSGTDVVGIRQTIKARGTLTRGLPPTSAGESTSDTLARLKYSIMRHRRYFVWAPFGTVITEVGDRNNPNDPDRNIDLTNGPRCVGFNVLSVTEGCIEVEITVEVTELACSVESGRAVLSHRWRQQEDYDKRGYCTLTTVGTIVVRPGIAAAMKTVDIFNEAGVQGPREGYQRIEPIQHGWDETATMLTYIRTDKEFEVSPPAEAYEHDGDVVLLTPGNNVAAHAIISVRLKGNKGVSKESISQRATRIVASYAVRIQAELDGKATPVVNSRYRVPMYDNAVEIQMIVIADPKKYNAFNGGIRHGIFAAPPDGSFLRGTPAARNQAFAPLLGQAQSTDMVRPDLQEPCEAIEVQELRGGFSPFTRSGLAPSLQNIIGNATPTPGPIAGGGGPNAPGLNQQPAEPGGLSPEDQQRALDFLRLRMFSREPVFPPVSPTADVGNPGGAVNGFSNQFGSFGGNEIQNTTSQSRSRHVEPIDVPIPYTVYVISMTISYDSGKRVIPSCGPRGADGKLPLAPVARIHNGHADMVVTWSATRSGAPPQIPDPYPEDENYVLTKLDTGTDELERHPEGNFRYRRTGVYQYSLRSVEETKIFDVIPPMILREVQASAPAGLGTDAVAPSKDILWWSMRLAQPSPIFRA